MVDQAVYNGLKKIDSSQLNFMTELNIRRVMSTIKIKNCEGWERIPQRIFVEGIEVLAAPLTNLFNKIYEQMLLPEQWLMAKIIPVHKKGPKNEYEP